MSLTLGGAAKATGLSKSTILRSIKAGRISAARNVMGDWAIEPVELHRVYPPATADSTPEKEHQAMAHDVHRLEAEIANLKEMATLLREQLKDAQVGRDAWRDQAQATLRTVEYLRPRAWFWKRAAA